MRNLLIAFYFFLSLSFFAQAPQYINYQAIARDASNNIVTTSIGIKFEIFQGSVGGTLVYDETHTATPSSAGIFTVNIGAGLAGTGTFSAIVWGNGPYFLQVKIDPNGGTSYSTVGASKLVSVPYALYAEKAGSSASYTAGNGITISSGTITNAAPDQTVTLNQGTNITVNGTYPNFSIASTPSLSITGNSLSISGGNGVLIPSSGTFIATPNTSLTSTGNILISTTGTNTFNLNVPYQTLSLAANVLSISGGNSVTLPTPPTLTLNGTGIAAVSPTVGNNFTINVPPVGITFVPGTGILSYSPAPGINSINISPALSFSNMILSVGSNTVPIPGTGLWSRTTATATTLSNGTDEVGIGTNNPLSKLDVLSSSFNLLSLRTSAGGNTNVNVDGYPAGTGYFQFKTSTPNAIAFVTNNLQRVLFDVNGNVGIGTTSPLAPLDVTGKTITDSIQISGPGSPTSGSLLMSRDNMGNAKWSPGPVAFHLQFAPTTAIALTTNTVNNLGNNIQFSNALTVNVGGGFSTTNGQFTAPVAGLYHLQGSIEITLNAASVGNNWIYLELCKAPAAPVILKRSLMNNTDASLTTYATLQVDAVVSLVAGEVVYLRAIGNSGGSGGSITNLNQPNLINSFSGYLIR